MPLLPLHLELSRNGFRRKADGEHSCIYPGLLPLVRSALFVGSDGLILELAEESSLLLSFLGRIRVGYVVFWHHASAVVVIEGVATGIGW
jgi:hypothetical protein